MNSAFETAERNDVGQFVNRPGPGRPSKKLKALQDRYRSESQTETLRLLADQLVELEVVESISPETVRQTLKKTA